MKIFYGGITTPKSEKRAFDVERMFDEVSARIIVAQFDSKVRTKQELRKKVTRMENELKELRLHLKAMERE